MLDSGIRKLFHSNIFKVFPLLNTVIRIYIVLFTILFAGGTAQLKAQCAPETYSLKCIGAMDENAIYLKSFNIDGHKMTGNLVEYSMAFGYNVNYLFKICTALNHADGIVLTIYNSRREVMTTNVHDDHISDELKFQCPATGIYYLNFSFNNSSELCGGCILTIGE